MFYYDSIAIKYPIGRRISTFLQNFAVLILSL